MNDGPNDQAARTRRAAGGAGVVALVLALTACHEPAPAADRAEPAETAAAPVSVPAATDVDGASEPRSEMVDATSVGSAVRGVDLRGCASAAAPTAGIVAVTFEPSGQVSEARVDAPLGGTEVGRCVARRFVGLRARGWRRGFAVTVRQTFTAT